MGKPKFFLPKAMAKRFKSKRPQRVIWFCRICQKQCRDKVGFMRHCLDKGHLTPMQLFQQSSDCVSHRYNQQVETTVERMNSLCLSSEVEVPDTNRVVDPNNETTLLKNMSMLNISQKDGDV